MKKFGLKCELDNVRRKVGGNKEEGRGRFEGRLGIIGKQLGNSWVFYTEKTLDPGYLILLTWKKNLEMGLVRYRWSDGDRQTRGLLRNDTDSITSTCRFRNAEY